MCRGYASRRVEEHGLKVKSRLQQLDTRCDRRAEHRRCNPSSCCPSQLVLFPYDKCSKAREGVAMAVVTQAYRFALDPTRRQQRALASHCGAARYAYNWGLELVKTRLDERQADPTVIVPWSLPELRREWNHAKQQVAPWWPENSKETYASGLDGLARALKNWSDSKSGRRKGRPVNFPRFKKKGRARDACRFTTGAIKVLGDRKHVQLPRIGVLKTHESTRKLARRLEHGTARILAATISRTADRWFVSFTVEAERHVPASNGKRTLVGVDAGIRHLAVLSNGVVIANPRSLEHQLRTLRRLNRQLARCQPGSKRRNQTRRKLARIHARAANVRNDVLHKLTAALVTEHGTVVVEHLNLAWLVRNRHVAPRSDRCRPRRTAPSAHLQDDLVRQPARRGRPVLSLVQDVLGLWMGESQAHPGRAHIHLRGLRTPD
jgi:putative transposase